MDCKAEKQEIKIGREGKSKGDRTGVALCDRCLMMHSCSLVAYPCFMLI